MAEIVLDDVWKTYPDGTEAVRSLDLTIADEEFIVLVGPSGCGKTTALRMVAGLEDDHQGERADRRPRGQRRPAQGAGHRDGVPELRAVPAHERVRQHGLRVEAAEAGQGRDRAAGSAEAADILGLDELLERKPAALSGGQRQRVAMGRAIVRHPQAFLMDEPLSNLDAKLRVQMRSEIARIQHDLGVTTIYVTHDQTEAMTMGDRVAVMRKGVLQQVDTPAGALRAPGQPLRRRVHRVPRDEPASRPRSPPTATAWLSSSAASACPCPPEVVAGRAGPARPRRPHDRARHPPGGHGGRRPCVRRAARPAHPVHGRAARGARLRRGRALRRRRTARHRPSDVQELASDVGAEALELVAPAGGGRAPPRSWPGSTRVRRSPRASPSSWWSTPTACTSSTPTDGRGDLRPVTARRSTNKEKQHDEDAEN